MKKRLMGMLLVTLTVLSAPRAVHAQDSIPERFVGIWATRDSVLVGETLWGGEALYIDANGDGALVSAPLPVKMCGQNVCQPSAGIKARITMSADNALVVTLQNGSPDASSMPTVIVSSAGTVLQFDSRSGQHLQLERRASLISPAMREGLKLSSDLH